MKVPQDSRFFLKHPRQSTIATLEYRHFGPMRHPAMNVDTGLQPIGRVDWGAHFCHFYRNEGDLVETLVPYFKTGLEANEACLWVTAEPFGKEAALAQLRACFGDINERIAAGQLAVYDHSEWYERVAGRTNVVDLWVEAKNEAIRRGYRGLRLSGNTAFLSSEDWDDFADYEAAVRRAFGDHEILALCSYQADRWNADAVLDVIQNHDFALARRRGSWDVIESASVKKTKEALLALNADLERRVAERTQALSDSLEKQKLLTAELSHRVKNTIASAQSLVDQTLRGASSPAGARTTIAGRLAALGRAHDHLAAGDWTGVGLRDVIMGAAATFGTKLHVDIQDCTLTPRAALDLSLVFHELMTNAVKYGALSREYGSVSIRTSVAGKALVIHWSERGGPQVTGPSRSGFGTKLIRELITHDLRGECEFAYQADGLVVSIRAPVSEIVVPSATCLHGCGHH